MPGLNKYKVCGFDTYAGYIASTPIEGGYTVCEECELGETTTDGVECKGCLEGLYLPMNSTTCEVCSAGKYSNEVGANDATNGGCKLCPAGTFLIDNSVNSDAHLQKSQRLNCGSGKYSAAASPACTSCTAGKYLFDSKTGNEPSACSTCGPGTYSLISAAECKACPAGTYLVHDATLPINHDNVNDCIVCPRGKYLPDDGQTADEHRVYKMLTRNRVERGQ